MKYFSLLFAVIFSIHFIAIAVQAGCCSFEKEMHTDKKCCCNESENNKQCNGEQSIHRYCNCHCYNTAENEATANKTKNVILKKTPDLYKTNVLFHHVNNRITQLIIHFPGMRLKLDKTPLFRPLRI